MCRCVALGDRFQGLECGGVWALYNYALSVFLPFCILVSFRALNTMRGVSFPSPTLSPSPFPLFPPTSLSSGLFPSSPFPYFLLPFLSLPRYLPSPLFFFLSFLRCEAAPLYLAMNEVWGSAKPPAASGEEPKSPMHSYGIVRSGSHRMIAISGYFRLQKKRNFKYNRVTV